MQHKFETILLKLGLSEPASKTYIAALELGSTSATEIARRAKVNRSAVYDYLSELESRQLVEASIILGKKVFTAVNPSSLKEIVDRQYQEISSELPSWIQHFRHTGPNRPTLRYYRDVAGIKEIFEEILLSKSKHYDVVGSIPDDQFLELMSEKWTIAWTKRRIAKGVSHRSLRLHGSFSKKISPLLTESSKSVLREIRYLPENMRSPVMIHIFDNKVVFTKPQLGSPYSIVIESDDLAQMQTSIYETLWSISTPPTPYSLSKNNNKIIQKI